MSVRHVHCILSGRVQGVGLRWAVSQEAKRLGLSGRVRNNPDGTVEISAQGTASGVEALLAWLRQGPGVSEITGVDVQWAPPTRRFSASFSIEN